MVFSTFRATALPYPKSNLYTFSKVQTWWFLNNSVLYTCKIHLLRKKNDPPCIQKLSSAAIFSVSVTGSSANLFQVPLNSDFRNWDDLAHSRKSEKTNKKKQAIQVTRATQYNTFFMLKITAAADSWTEPGLQLACSVSHKYTAVAVLIKSFTTVYVHCRHFGLLTLGSCGCFNFPSRISEYMGRTDHNNAYFQAAVLNVN